MSVSEVSRRCLRSVSEVSRRCLRSVSQCIMSGPPTRPHTVQRLPPPHRPVPDAHQLTGGHALSALGWALFERHGVRAALGISADRMRAFLAAVEGGYHSVPYHNSVHA